MLRQRSIAKCVNQAILKFTLGHQTGKLKILYNVMALSVELLHELTKLHYTMEYRYNFVVYRSGPVTTGDVS